jgi:transcriptional regulator with XRE-family HTH domain
MKSTVYTTVTDPGEHAQTPLKALGSRIGEVADLYPNRKSAAEAAGISTDQLARYLRGENQPGLLSMASLLKPHGISLDWLANGEGENRGKNLDAELLELILQTVEEALQKNDLVLTPDKKSKLVALLYSLHEGGNKDALRPANVIRLIDYGNRR